MFEEDIKKIKACIEYNDYYSAMEYAILVKDNYKDNQKRCFENIIKYVKSGHYYQINNIIKLTEEV